MVNLTQDLGGNFTVRTDEGLFRIGSVDADALGLAPATAEALSSHSRSDATTDPAAFELQLWETLKSCYDPEIPVNIVDLGLIYDVRIEPSNESGRRVEVKMTLTAPGCGMGGVIAGDAQQKLMALPGVDDAVVEVVWDPPWHQSMITPEGRRVLGLE
jgi:probable FeS assembly SUF system protein SufT